MLTLENKLLPLPCRNAAVVCQRSFFPHVPGLLFQTLGMLEGMLGMTDSNLLS